VTYLVQQLAQYCHVAVLLLTTEQSLGARGSNVMTPPCSGMVRSYLVGRK
jgi:hypothetical protein